MPSLSQQIIRLLEKKPAELHLEAIPLLAAEKTRSMGLRVTAAAALRQKHDDLALDATAELVARADAERADRLLRARALQAAGHAAEALEVLRAEPESGTACAIAASAHAALGQLAPADRAALRALELGELGDQDERQMQWLHAYMGAAVGTEAGPLAARWGGPVPPAGVPVIALLDYRAPDADRKSRNVGDWIQTLAGMRHLARLDGVEWSYDDPGLEPLMQRLRATWDEGELIACGGRAHIAVMDRDYPLTASQRFPGRTVWVIGNGWYSHSVFNRNCAWPTPQGVEPLLLSVHMAHASDLRPEVLAWLRERGPVGCRDLSTLEWLRNQGVPAFHSGCLTMTLRPVGGLELSDERLMVDVEAGDEADDASEDWTALSQLDPKLRADGFAASMERAAATVNRFAAAAQVRTGRLHCALPARAVHTPVEFNPSVAQDRRFEGLVGIPDAEWTRLRDGLSTLLARLLPLIVGGAAPRVVRAALRDAVPLPEQPRLARPDAMVPRLGPVPKQVTLVLAFDANFVSQARTVLASLRARTRAQLRLVLLVRGVDQATAEGVAALARPVAVQVFAMDGRLEGVAMELLDQISVSTMDRLFLPELLPDADRVVYLDCDTLVFGDVAALAACQPGSTGIAARPTPNPRLNNIAEAVERRARGLDPAGARALRAWSAANTDLAAPYFNAGVMVMSLRQMRRNRTAQRALELVRRFGLHDQDALNLATGGYAAAIPDTWNSMPGVDLCARPDLVHWVGRRKPWLPAPARFQAEWQQAGELGRPVVDRQYWSDPASYEPNWARRAELAAAWLPASGRIADIGCGAPMALRRFLAAGAEYVPADLTAWTAEVQVVDLDAGDFPEGRFEAVAMLGVLEYLQRPGPALRRARKATDRLVTTYCHPRPSATHAFRARRGWVNALREDRFEELLQAQGWAVTDRKLFAENEQITQIVYHCTACEPAEKPRLGPLAEAVRADRLTYLRPEKMARLEAALDAVLDQGVPGEFVEFGVALGGSAIVAAERARRSGRRFVGYDVFAMIPPPTSGQDDVASRERYERIASGQSTGIGGDVYYGYREDLLGEVTEAFARHGVPVDGEWVQLVKGLFAESWPKHPVSPIAFAHVDCDWHDPVSFCLEVLGRELAPGGAIVIDDYHDYSGARAATDAFLATHPDFVMEQGPNPVLRRKPASAP